MIHNGARARLCSSCLHHYDSYKKERDKIGQVMQFMLIKDAIAKGVIENNN